MRDIAVREPSARNIIPASRVHGSQSAIHGDAESHWILKLDG